MEEILRRGPGVKTERRGEDEVRRDKTAGKKKKNMFRQVENTQTSRCVYTAPVSRSPNPYIIYTGDFAVTCWRPRGLQSVPVSRARGTRESMKGKSLRLRTLDEKKGTRQTRRTAEAAVLAHEWRFADCSRLWLSGCSTRFLAFVSRRLVEDSLERARGKSEEEARVRFSPGKKEEIPAEGSSGR
ncbi:hypothetical protein TGDOM2_231215 [Toxoplasma gondii GAB2-2007-GAL-DOM2]|uniref:Uncharacterized protein n=4 Tax=Toxoplasma gondii TaxID=5811 RepID=S7V246_TOXGG|nr:hypothetical protein TGGT1_231215 [Toxoplasma gondii GT1]KFG48499.1 hypothetical protein TGDOM2_231215 [Toxoplasma gondii GAB2-2007-GAL-DOM2]PUA92748.1 hypothetical protein TGBR9_380440 [Toxoplasma gondii TgCATBr9]RQX75881.1 hypothetical protein TGCAST_231215 [Toxoplasma gondii CAST]